MRRHDFDYASLGDAEVGRMARKPSRKHVPLVRLLARGDPVGGDAVRPLPAVTAQRAGPSLRARHRHLPRDGQEGGSRFGRCSPRRCASKPTGAGAWRRSRSELSYLRRAVDHEGDVVESFTLAQMESARWFLGNSLRGFHPGSSARTSPRRKRANQRYRPPSDIRQVRLPASGSCAARRSAFWMEP